MVLGALYAAYTITRLAAADDLAAARSTSAHILHLERWFGIDVEHALAVWTSAHQAVGIVASYWYAAAHYVVTGAVLLFVWFRHRDLYARSRNVLVIATVAALAVYLLMPTAPPRFMPGYPDVLAQVASWGWWKPVSAPSGSGTVTNELAAMPSMHVGWAVWVALTLFSCWRGARARWLVWLYPVVTTLVVVATANHWVADVLVGAALVFLAHAVVTQASAPRSCSPSPP